MSEGISDHAIVSFGTKVFNQYGEQRIVYDENGNVTRVIEPTFVKNICIGPPVKRMRDDHIKK